MKIKVSDSLGNFQAVCFLKILARQGNTRNTVVGDVEIAEAEGSPINRDLGKANEVTKDTHSRTNINVEPQVIEYLTNPGKLKEDIGKAKKEISDVTTAIKESINDRGDDNRNFFGQLREVRLSETVNNIAGKRLTEAQKSEDVVSAWKDDYKDLGYNLDVKYTTGEIAFYPIKSKEFVSVTIENEVNKKLGDLQRANYDAIEEDKFIIKIPYKSKNTLNEKEINSYFEKIRSNK